MTKNDQFEVNFFKPRSDHARANTKLIMTLVIIWAVCVFGFQFLLMILNTPTPEKSYTTFTSVWPQVVENESATVEMKQDFSRVLLSVLGKNIAVKDGQKDILRNALSKTIFSMQDESTKQLFQREPDQETYDAAINSIELAPDGFDKLMRDLLPTSLVQVEDGNFDPKCKEALPGIMELYLVHNQNFFTNFKFLKFPFHYWYTAQFLLIMFVVLCLVYATVIERLNKKYNFVETT